MDILTANDTALRYPPSFYAASTEHLPAYPAPKGEYTFDVCIIGAGFSGLSAALKLAGLGYKVAVLEAQRVGFGASGRNGGQVGMGQRVDQPQLESWYGKNHARELWDLSKDSVNLVKQLCTEIPDCPFHSGIIHALHRKRFVAEEHRRVEHMNTHYDQDLKPLNQAEIRDMVGSNAYYGGSLDMQSGHIHPLKFCLGLAKLATKAGAQIFENARVVKLDEPTKNTTANTTTTHTKTARIKAAHVIIACNGYLGDLQPEVARHVMPVNNFIIATAPMDAPARARIIANNFAVVDSKFVVNYFRFSDCGRLLFGGTESYGYRYPQDIAGKVRGPLTQIFPQLKDIKIDYAWGGTLAITRRRLPYFARVGRGIYSISGYSGHGVAMATLGGRLAAEAIAGRAQGFDILANLPKTPFPGGAQMRSPLLVAAMLWYGLRDRF